MPTKIILDCDPGVDDALAIAFAVGSPALDLIGITTVAGNVSLDKTTVNALRVCDYLGAPGVPVTAGSAGPLERAALTAEHVHEFDEWFLVVEGSYTLTLDGHEVRVGPGQEYVIPKGTRIAGRVTAGTRTLHAFGGRRAERERT